MAELVILDLSVFCRSFYPDPCRETMSPLVISPKYGISSRGPFTLMQAHLIWFLSSVSSVSNQPPHQSPTSSLFPTKVEVGAQGLLSRTHQTLPGWISPCFRRPPFEFQVYALFLPFSPQNVFSNLSRMEFKQELDSI